MSLLVEKYTYKKIPRKTCEQTGKRVYETPTGERLPSVTTILDQTSDKTFLNNWRKRIGKQKADEITKLSAGIGSLFHTDLENYISDIGRPTAKTQVRKIAKTIADVVIEKGLINVQEIWGLESPLYYPGLYAGTADVIGVFNNKESIMDFKNTRKPKKIEWLENYFLQLKFYANAHNILFGTNINQGVIFMVSREEEYLGEYQEFVVDLTEWEDKWLERLEKFYNVN